MLNEIVLVKEMTAQLEAMNLAPPSGATIGRFVAQALDGLRRARS